MKLVHLSIPLALAGSSVAVYVQHPFLVLPPSAAANREAVKKIFTESYDAYKKYAWGHDDLAPISKGFTDSRNGWGASIVDAMSTMHIMGLTEWFEEAVNFTTSIDFSTSKTPDDVSVFETTIRYLGGLLSAYELSGGRYPHLVTKAKEVADKMAYAWIGTNGTERDVPYGHLNFATNLPASYSTSNIAEAGTLLLEWGTLSKYTGNFTYGNLTLRALRRIAEQPAPLPGLAAQGINPETGNSVGGYVTWGGGSDSYFEYLIKFARLSNSNDNLYADTWHTAVDSSIKTLLKKSTVGNRTYLADYDSSGRVRYVSSHLACFHGGNWLFGGKLLNNATIVKIGLELVDGCWDTYANTATGIGPEGFAFISPDGNYTGDPITDEQKAFADKNGFYVTSGYYILRPEVLESNFYAWRVTGDTKYLDRAATAVTAFNKYLQTDNGFAGIEDVNNSTSIKVDDTESFWFAEVLKYLYLTFDDPNHIHLDQWIFNTEAHPFKAPPPKFSYGSQNTLPHWPWGPFHPQAVMGADLPDISPTAKIPGKKAPST